MRKNKDFRRDPPAIDNTDSRSFEVICSLCGALIRSATTPGSEQMCLICHARILNDYLQELRKRSPDEGDSAGSAVK